MSDKDVLEKIVTARVGLLMKHPFFGNIATRLILQENNDWCQTAATDGRHIFYNGEFFAKYSVREIEFIIAHEILHCIFDHMGRINKHDRRLSNIAQDYAVNQVLKDDQIGRVPRDIQIYQHDKYRDWAWEEIYDDLAKDIEFINLDSLGELLDQHLEGMGSPGAGEDGQPQYTQEEIQKIRDDFKEAMISAAEAVGAGNLPTGVKRLFKELTEPKLDWRSMLQMHIQSMVRNDYSFMRPNRKSQSSGAVLPGLNNDVTIDLAISLDQSGSIGNTDSVTVLSEVKAIVDQYQDFNIKIWCFDTDIYNPRDFDQYNGEDIAQYELMGGGGTDFEVNWRWMKEQGYQPKRFVMFTDGYPFGSWGDPDYCETLFIVKGNPNAQSPFGQTVIYEDQ